MRECFDPVEFTFLGVGHKSQRLRGQILVEDGVETLDMSTQQVNESLTQHAADASKLMTDLGLAKQ